MGIKAMNKRGLQLKSAFFAAIVVGIIVTSTGIIVGEWDDKYNSGLNYDLGEYSDIDTYSDEAQEHKERLTPQTDDPGTGDFEGKILSGGYGVIGKIFSPFETIFNMLESIEDRFGLPSFLIEGILAMVFFAFIFAIIAVLFRLSRTP